MSNLLSQLPSPSLLVNDSSEIVAANPAATELLGIPEAELVGQTWAGVDAQLTLIHWKMHWQELSK